MTGGWVVLIVVGLLVCWPSWLGCQALQAAGGPIRITRGRRSSSSSRVPSGNREGGKSRERRGGSSPTCSSDRSFDAKSNGGGSGGPRRATRKIKRSYSRGSMSVMARMRRKVGLALLSCMHITTTAVYIRKSLMKVSKEPYSLPHPPSAGYRLMH